ncbi:LysR family transcriptional regulator [Vibrio penaeicida]|uniref:LysR family transcriptional regulator n=1 Tax=Vibrio penaeicida TaxID=104609 RepID=UPI002736E1A4|nr:LysR family transcriptional regulator [Vibrio penaeicida]MDP2573639.1 LysR family transcriptional regulator [Vibrio penaeicida]
MLKIQHLRFLVSVVDYGSAIKASERLYVSQPSISAGLKALEDELGGALFDRSGPANRPLRLTPKGQNFYRRAIEILNQCESAQAEFAGNSNQTSKWILGVLDTLSQDVVVKALRTFERGEPDTRIDIWEGSATKIESWFAKKRVDMILGNVGSLMPNEKLLWREPLVAVVAPDHPCAGTTNVISIRDLTQFPFIHRTNCELDQIGRARLKAEGVKLNIHARAERESLAFELIRNSHNMTLAPQNLVPENLTSIRVSGLNIERSIGLRWQENTPIQVTSALSESIVKIIGEPIGI